MSDPRPIDDEKHLLLMNEIVRGFLSVAQDPKSEGLPSSPDVLFHTKHERPIGTPPSYFEIGEALGILARVYALKNIRYGSSWCKRGPFEIFFNVSRKFDRIENLIIHQQQADRLSPDDVTDLANYSIMQLAYHLGMRKSQFVQWAQSLFHQGVGL